MDTKKVVETVGKMILRNSKPMPDDGAARRAFDRYVLAVASGSYAIDLTEAQLRVLQGCDRRAHDLLPKEVSTALGFVEGKTYRDAVNLCERQGTLRAEEEKADGPKEVRVGKAADRRRSDRRGPRRPKEAV